MTLGQQMTGAEGLVRRIRAERGLTQEGLARELGVSFATINGWENGRHKPIPALARRLAELAGHDDVPATEVQERITEADSVVRTASSGWPPDERERRSFYGRPREFPGDVARWRAELVERVLADATTFPASPSPGPDVVPLRGRARKDHRKQAATEQARELVDEGVGFLRELARILAVLYGTPTLGNKPDPMDELVYIILSRKTREGAYQQAYEALRGRFARWDDVLLADRKEVERLLAPSGLAAKKTLSIFAALEAINLRFGRCTLEPLRGMPDADVEAFLCSLPEIHRKSAYCIMMYSLGRAVFPVDTHVGRVLARLAPYRELGLDLTELDHKGLQKVLAELVPPNLRHSLHVNLVVHGREVCRAVNPQCGACDLRGLCADFRKREATRVEALGQPRIVDLFTGAGGLSEGFQRAGFEVAVAVDIDPAALRTYRLNHVGVRDERVLCRDIRSFVPGEFKKRVGRGGIEVLIGAPPCQGFSHVGHRSKKTLTGYDIEGDARNFLYEGMIATAAELRPKLFLMENVPGMSSARKGDQSFLEAAARDLKELGYSTDIWRLNAAAYGVPQERVRFFLVASRTRRLPERPRGAYRDALTREPDADALPPITFDDATFDLPAREANGGPVVDLWPAHQDRTPARYRRYLSKFGLLSPSRLLMNHTVRYHNERDLELYSLLRPGEDSIHALERHKRDDLMRYRSDVFDDKYARLRGDRPCKTIVAHLAKDGNGYIHPTQVRSISFREAARVQSFRDDYVFCGSPSDQWVHLGNAVPPVLAEAIARSFIAALGSS